MAGNSLVLGNRYEIISRIGTGGMADVYKARDAKLNRFVAIKVLKKEFSEDSKFISKFKVEAQSAARLTHPNIVNVYDVVQEMGVNYIVMELVDGITLKDFIERKGRITEKEAITIGVQVCAGMEIAHRSHIIHRDIKPQNIIISKEGKVKVTDFGIARAASTNTNTQGAFGSVHYSSPEQVRGGYSDAKSDIYSFGISLYEMLTGRVPFDGDSTVNIAIKHLQEPIDPPSKYVPDIQKDMENIILKCTEKNPENRYDNVKEIIDDLKSALNNINLLEASEIERVNSEAFNDSKERNNYTKGESSNGELDKTKYFGNNYGEMDLEDEEDEEELENTKKMGFLTRLLVIISVLILGSLIIFFVGKKLGLISINSLFSTKTVEAGDILVPNVVGMEYKEAKEKLNELGLGIKEKGREESTLFDVDYVIAQDTVEGEGVKENSTILVTVSSGKNDGNIEVPNIIGKTKEEASNILSNLGLTIEVKEENSDSIAKGIVLRQNPIYTRKLNSGEKVRITVSKGPSKVTVPNFVGMGKDEAIGKIRELNLTIKEYAEVYSKDIEEGKVTDQSIKEGEKVDINSEITISISIGKDPNWIEGEEDGETSEETYTAKEYVGSATINSDGYSGGKLRVELTQDGVTSTVLEVNKVSMPYTFSVGSDSSSTGTIKIYEKKEDGAVVALASQRIQFTKR